jgi:hypothetical protein
MKWLFSFFHYTETARLFNRALRIMVLSAVVAGFGIAAFAWAVHPKESKESKSEPAAVAVAPKAPALVEVDLSHEGAEALADDLGSKCDPDAFEAVAVGGTAETPEVVSVPTAGCKLDRFVLTSEVGTYKSLEPLTKSKEVPPHG